jgi:hypothetical protein
VEGEEVTPSFVPKARVIGLISFDVLVLGSSFLCTVEAGCLDATQLKRARITRDRLR